MGFKLRVYFTGLCMFSPSNAVGDADGGENDKQADDIIVLMPNAKDPRPLIEEERKAQKVRAEQEKRAAPSDQEIEILMEMEPHDVVVQIPWKNLPGRDVTYPLLAAGGSRDYLYAHWSLEKEDLEFLGSEGPVRYTRLRSISGAPDATNHKAFDWIPPIRDREGEIHSVREDLKDFKGSIPQTDQELLTSRLRLRGGRIRPATFHLNEGGHYFLIWKLGEKHNGKGYEEQAVPKVVVWETKVNGDVCLLQATRFHTAGENPPRPRYVRVGPDPNRKDDVVEIWVVNLERGQVIHKSAAKPVRIGVEYTQDREIHLYYMLAEPNDFNYDFRPIPVRAEGRVEDSLLVPPEDCFMRCLYFPTDSGEAGGMPACEPRRG